MPKSLPQSWRVQALHQRYVGVIESDSHKDTCFLFKGCWVYGVGFGVLGIICKCCIGNSEEFLGVERFRDFVAMTLEVVKVMVPFG